MPALEVERVKALFEAAGLPTQIHLSAAQRKKLFAAMRLDKKVNAGEIKFVLAKKIGETTWGQQVPEAIVESAVAFLSPVTRHSSLVS
jgi:3-dehydroquinate synthase